MDDLGNVWADETVRAAHWAMRELPTPPEVKAALNAKSDLWGRLSRDGYREPTRDERRLAARYERVVKAHERDVLDAYRSKAAPSTGASNDNDVRLQQDSGAHEAAGSDAGPHEDPR